MTKVIEEKQKMMERMNDAIESVKDYVNIGVQGVQTR